MSAKLQLLSILFRTCTLLLILLAGVRSVEHYWDKPFSGKNVVCRSKKCHDFGKRLSEMISRSADPCDDFYDFVCREWIRKHPLPPNFNEWSTDTELQLETFRIVKDLLEEPIQKVDGFGMMAAKKFYRECMKIPNNGMHDATVIRYNVKPIGYFPLISKPPVEKKRWQLVHNYYLGFTGESGLFYLGVHVSRRDNYEPMLNLQELWSPFGLIKGYVMSNNDQKNYVKFLEALVTKVFPEEVEKNPQLNLHKEIAMVVTFRTKLEKIKEKTAEVSNLYHPITVGEMNKRYKDIIIKENLKTEFDWIETIQIFRKQRESRADISNMMLNLGNRVYFQLLARLLSKTPDDVIVNHIHLYFIERHTELDSHLRSLLLNVVITNGNEHGQIRYYGEQWINCISINVLNDPIAKHYVKKYFPHHTKTEVENLVKELKGMMKVQIRESTWLSERMMDKFDEKIEDMRAIIGYPEYYDDPHKQLENPSAAALNPLKLDAYYLQKSNLLSISAATLRSPIYDSSLPHAVNYGGVGECIAHEMYHAFGSKAVDFGSTKNAVSKRMATIYEERLYCFIEKFNQLPVQELEEIQPIATIDGYKTLDENVPDLMGVKLAFWSFRKKVWDTRKCETLPYMEDFTCDQLYFISSAATYCSTLTPDTFLSNLNNGVHCPPRVRVNEAVRNFEVFNKIFKCNKPKSGSKRSSCDLWK